MAPDSRSPYSETWMRIAIEEARRSLREGYDGFGAVVLKSFGVLARAHDAGAIGRDAAAHAEMRAVQEASSLAGSSLAGCLLVCTHEPCPTCAKAIVRAGISRVIYGYGARNARIDRTDMQVEGGLLRQECAVLYDREVRAEVHRLRGATEEQLREYGRQLVRRRLEWYRREKGNLRLGSGDSAERAYRLLLAKLGIAEAEAPVVHKEEGRVVFHSRNFCPTLEACGILGLDTRRICRLCNEEAADRLIRQLDSRLRFSRNYDKIRPYGEYCEERIEVAVMETFGIRRVKSAWPS
jgi:tRNA(adenine34) deaminase